MRKDLAEQKIEALLHDPPGKAPTLWYRSHEAFAADLVKLTLGREPRHEELVKTADRYASAVDRAGLVKDPVSYRVDFLRDAQIVHPLSGTRYPLGVLVGMDLTRLEEEQKVAVADLVQRASGAEHDLERLYWYLWRGLGEALAVQGDVGRLWTYLPADTRNPDHSIWDHMALTSAFAGALPKPALLVFSFGPVQPLIAAARRTGDLWAGSFLLSWLAWRAMRRLVGDLGGDAVLFPHLRGQPLVDGWLGGERGWSDIPGLVKPSDVASLPNRFLALVPAEVGVELAARCEADLRVAARDFTSGCVGDFVKRHCGGRNEGEWARLACAEISRMLTCYWHVLPWVEDPVALREMSERVLGKTIAPFWDLLDQLGDKAVYRPNLGTYFAAQSSLAEAGHGAAKACRSFTQFGEEETGRRCSVCGIGRALWDPRGAAAVRSNRALKEGEALCGLCAARRQAPKSEWAKQLAGDSVQFPSTHNLAASRFFEGVLDRLASKPSGGQGKAPDIAEALKRFLDAVDSADSGHATRLLFRMARGAGTDPDSAQRLVQLPAELLLADTYRDQDALDELGFVGDAADAQRRLTAFLGACESGGIQRPGRYYAVLAMDGDHMGRWLSGELAPMIGEVLHEGARPTDGATYLGMRRPLSGAHQVAVSRALSEFSLGIVRPVVEGVHAGVVVYCGGDDLLALLPLHRLFACLRDLRRLYSGLPLPADSSAGRHGFESGRGFVRRGKDLWRVMGERATCSMGVAVAHQKWPLRHALETSRRMENPQAKIALGRNAVAIGLLKRSGGHEEFGARWGRDNGVCDPDPLAVLQELVSLIAEEKVSRRFAYALQAEVPVLWHLPGALEERAYWFLDRHWMERKVVDGHPKKTFEREHGLQVAGSLAALARELETLSSNPGGDDSECCPKPAERFMAGLGLAEFIARDIRGGAA